jgi:hypothetical protein
MAARRLAVFAVLSHAQMLLLAGPAVAIGIHFEVGDLATIGTGDAAQCARVTYIDANPTGVSWYWLELERGPSPRSVFRLRLEQLQPGCGPAVAGGANTSRPR